MNGHFIFDDVNSADFKVWIKAGGTYNAASRRFSVETVPGRMGNLTVDDGAFEETEHSYECHIGDNFPQNIQDFRNAIMSKVGRFILRDSFHEDEYYRARYMRGVEPDVAALAKAGAFTLTFSRDPRRFLISGDVARPVTSISETSTGNVITIDNRSGYPSITDIAAQISPKQEGSGDPSPTNVRAITGFTGANIMHTSRNILKPRSNGSASDVTLTRRDDGGYDLKGTCSGTNGLSIWTSTDPHPMKSGVKYYYNVNLAWKANGTATPELQGYIGSTSVFHAQSGSYTCTDEGYGTELIRIRVENGKSYDCTIYPCMTVNDPDTSFERGSQTITDTSWSDAAGTVYCGTFDYITGVLTATYAVITFDGTESITMPSSGYFYLSIGASGVANNDYAAASTGWCSHYKVATDIHSTNALKAIPYSICYNNATLTAVNGRTFIVDGRYSSATDLQTYFQTQYNNGTPVQLVYKLETPVTYQLTANARSALPGINNFWADTGNTSVTVSTLATVDNPTHFASKPLIRVHGQGTLAIGGSVITVTGSYPYIDIDAELGDCNYNGVNANSVVSFAGGFPELKPGTSYVSYTGFSAVEVTPRWWRL